jgi:integration host factor subunit alpha
MRVWSEPTARPLGRQPGEFYRVESIDTGYINLSKCNEHYIFRIYERVGGLSKKEASQIVETIFDLMKSTLEAGDKIKLSGFGNFVVRDKNSRIGRNPQTGNEITISARRVLTFKPSQVLKNTLNS